MRKNPSSCDCTGIRTQVYNGNVQQNPLCVESCMSKELPISTRFSPTIFYRDASSVLLLAHLSTAVDYAQNHVFEIVHQESVKVYLHMYTGNVQQNP